MNEYDDGRTREVAVLSAGTMVSHYKILRKIGAGGMGEIYLAEDTRLKRKIALKFLSPELSSRPEARARFTREAQSVAALNHPNVVHIYEVGEHAGRPFFAMEYITGVSLHNFAHEDPQPVDTVVDLIIQVCEGLKAAHGKDIVHRDIKASNIVVDTEGRPRILDFGLASVADDQSLTKTGSTLGTVAYMSPEQAQGKKLDHRSDLFSLGIVLYELLAGRTPFRRDSAAATLQAIVNDDVPPPMNSREIVPAPLQNIVLKLLEKDPDLRYQSAAGVLPDLKALRIKRTTGPVETVQAPKRKLMPLLATAIIVVAGLLILFIWQPWSNTATVETSEPMLAVLPFENLGDPEDEYFADGITDEISSRLGMIQGVGVISPNSSARYKNTHKSNQQIGEELGVKYLVTGTVRWERSGNVAKVRTTPRLIRIADDRQLWSNTYERALIEAFEVQADIALQVVNQLGVTLVEHSPEELAARPTENAGAYDFYLKGLSEIRGKNTMFENASQGLADMDSAIARDSNFALAYAWKSVLHAQIAFGQEFGDSGHVHMARWAANKALQLDPDNAYAHYALGNYYNLTETDYETALTEFNSAQTELHDNTDVLAGIALVQVRQGRFVEAQENMKRVIELDPLAVEHYATLANYLHHGRNYDEALEFINRAISLDPTNSSYYMQKLQIIVDKTGDENLMRKIIADAQQYLDSVQSAGILIHYSKLIDMPEDSLALRLIPLLKRTDRIQDLFLEDRYSQLFRAYSLVGDEEAARVYADSARAKLERALKNAPDNGQVHLFLGLALAQLGECTRAEEEGRKGNEILSIDKCHW